MSYPSRPLSYRLRRRLGISEVRREKLVLALKRLGDIWSSVVHHRMGQIGVAILVFSVAVALLAPVISPWDPFTTVDEQYLPPYTEVPVARNVTFQLWDPATTWDVKTVPAAQQFEPVRTAGANSSAVGDWLTVTGFALQIYRDDVETVGFVAWLSPAGTAAGQYLAVRVSFDGGQNWSDKYPVRPVGTLVAWNLTDVTTWTTTKLNSTNLALNITHESDAGTGNVSLDYIGVTTVWRSFWHMFGTDQNGRDILARVIWGSRVSLLVGFLASVIAGVLGTLVGLISGYWGGWRDEVLMRINDILLSLPWLALLIVLAQILGGQLSLSVIILTIGLTSWNFTARVVRAQVLSVRERVFVERAKASGASGMSIVRRHIFPNVFPLVFANTILTVAIAILSESTLAFLGKVDVGTLSWGVVLHEAEASSAIINGHWAWIVMPGLALVFVILGFSLLGYALDEILNPKLRER